MPERGVYSEFINRPIAEKDVKFDAKNEGFDAVEGYLF
jgi:hypothetical protein